MRHGVLPSRLHHNIVLCRGHFNQRIGHIIEHLHRIINHYAYFFNIGLCIGRFVLKTGTQQRARHRHAGQLYIAIHR